jgi:hypothetical protein
MVALAGKMVFYLLAALQIMLSDRRTRMETTHDCRSHKAWRGRLDGR